MRISGIALLSTSASTTSALWPEEPTGPVPHLMSFGSDQAVVLESPIKAECERRKKHRQQGRVQRAHVPKEHA